MQVRKIDQIAKEGNVFFTGYPLVSRQDIENALAGSGLIIAENTRISYRDNGLFATFTADNYGKRESYMAIAWGTLSEPEKETWLLHWRKL